MDSNKIVKDEITFDTIMQFDEVDELVPTIVDMTKYGFIEGDKVTVTIKRK